MAPWGSAPRHRTWASDTILASVSAVVVITIYIVWEWLDTAPQGMVTLVGLAGGFLFGAVTGDKKKRDADVEATAQRAEAKAERADSKADALTRVAEREHPADVQAEQPPLRPPAKGSGGEHV